ALQALKHAYAQGPRSGATALLALELMESGVSSAEPMVQEYMQHQPAPTIQMAYARVLMAQNRLDNALEQLTRLLKGKPDMPDAWMALASLHAQQANWKKAQEALQRLESLVEKMPALAQRTQALTQAYMLGGRISLQQKDYAQALNWLEKIPSGIDTLNVQS